jgi:hypothetical protein
MYGQAVTDENCPTVAGSWALADETAISCIAATQCNATNPLLTAGENVRNTLSEAPFSGSRSPVFKICTAVVNSIFYTFLLFIKKALVTHTISNVVRLGSWVGRGTGNIRIGRIASSVVSTNPIAICSRAAPSDVDIRGDVCA